MLPGKNLSHKNTKSLFFINPEKYIFFGIPSEISKPGRFFYFIYCQITKVTILINFQVSYNQLNT